MTIDLTKPELDIIVNLIDAGVKVAGLQALKPELLSVIQKFTAAVQEANKPLPDMERS